MNCLQTFKQPKGFSDFLWKKIFEDQYIPFCYILHFKFKQKKWIWIFFSKNNNENENDNFDDQKWTDRDYPKGHTHCSVFLKRCSCNWVKITKIHLQQPWKSKECILSFMEIKISFKIHHQSNHVRNTFAFCKIQIVASIDTFRSCMAY